MDDKTREELMETNRVVAEATVISHAIIDFLERSNVDMKVAVVACGIAFSSGSNSLGASLPTTIDIVRTFYKQAGECHETH